MKAATAQDFLKALEESRLLTPEQWQRVQQESSQNAPADAETLARTLIRERLLTNWQAGMLLAGRSKFFLGKYKLLKELGRGGMGAVYQAEHVALGRMVALKIMSPHLMQQDRGAVARFEREIQAASALNHPNIVAAFDAGHVENTHFLVMEYVPGEGLDAVIRREAPLPVSVACEYIRQAAMGLQHAFECGMVHRDIKPANLLLTWTTDGQTAVRHPLVKILDMGLARFTSGSDGNQGQLTQTGQVMGTPDYISPEQAQSTKGADIRSDIFSLGCTLFQLLSGRIPYSGDTVMEKLMARALHDAPRLRQYRRDAPPELEALVARMVARDPQSRFQTPAEVALALQKFVVSSTGWAASQTPAVAATRGALHADQSRESDQVAPVVLEPRFNQFLQDLAHEADADEELVETVSLPGGRKPDGQAETPTVSALPSTAGVAHPSVTRAGQKLRAQLEHQQRRDRSGLFKVVLISSAILLACAGAIVWHRLGATQLGLDWPEDERRKESTLEVDGFTLSLPLKGAIPIPAGRPGKRTLRLTRPGYQEVAAVLDFKRGETKLFRPEWKPTRQTERRQFLRDFGSATDALRTKFGGQWPTDENADVRQLVERYRSARSRFALSPDQIAYEALGRNLPSAADRLSPSSIPAEERRLAEAAIGQPLIPEVVAVWGDARFKHSGGYIVSLAVNAEGTLAATGSDFGTVCVWNLQTGELHQPPIVSTGSLYGLAFSDDGRWLAIPGTEIEIWSLAERRLEWTIPNASEDKRVDGLTFVPKRRWWAWGGIGNQVHRFDIEARTLLPVLEFPAAAGLVFGVNASRDGRWLAAFGEKGTVRLWDLDSGMASDLETGQTKVYSLEFSPDGQTLAIGGSTLQFWSVAERKLAQEFGQFHYGLNALSWNTKGTLIATNMGSNIVKTWDVSTGALHGTWEGRGRINRVARFTADDRLVTVGGEGEIQVWDVATRQETLKTAPQILTAALDPWGDWVALGQNDGSVELRSLSHGEILRRIPWGVYLNSLAVSPDGRWLGGVSMYEEYSHRLYDLSASEDRETREPQILFGLTHATSIAFTPDSRLVVGAGGGAVGAWTMVERKQVFRTEIANSKFPYYHPLLEITPDGKTAFVGTAQANGGEITVLALPKGNVRRQFSAHPVQAATLAPDSRYAITAYATGLSIVDLTQVEEEKFAYICPVHLHGFCSLANTADGRQVVGACLDRTVRFVPMKKFDIERELTLGPSYAASAKQLLATPDGRHLVLVMLNGTVWVLRIKADAP